MLGDLRSNGGTTLSTNMREILQYVTCYEQWFLKLQARRPRKVVLDSCVMYHVEGRSVVTESESRNIYRRHGTDGPWTHGASHGLFELQVSSPWGGVRTQSQ
jgi:hypothetical protein